MPNMISLRTFRLDTLKGHSIQFKAKEPTYVPPMCVPEAMAAGCVPADEDGVPFHDDTSKDVVEFKGDIRKSMLHIAVKTIAERNHTKDFDGAGNPKVDVVAERLGFDVNAAEVKAAFRLYMQAQAEGTEIELHEAAETVTRIIDADNKKDLVELADELGVPAEESKGLVARDLRKLLLKKFDGATA